jgi:hypothetical protein
MRAGTVARKLILEGGFSARGQTVPAMSGADEFEKQKTGGHANGVTLPRPSPLLETSNYQ